MDLLPVGLRLSGKPVLVVGGGAVALRKIRLLLRCQPRIVMVTPLSRTELRRMADAGKIAWRKRAYRPCDLTYGRRPVAVFACTDSETVNARVAREAGAAGIWVNRADSPNGSTVHVPSIARLGPLTLAIFSGGRAPVFVKYVRQRLERMLGPHVAVELNLLAEFRRRLRDRVGSAGRRKRILTRLVQDGAIERMSRLNARRRKSVLNKELEDRI